MSGWKRSGKSKNKGRWKALPVLFLQEKPPDGFYAVIEGEKTLDAEEKIDEAEPGLMDIHVFIDCRV